MHIGAVEYSSAAHSEVQQRLLGSKGQSCVEYRFGGEYLE
jgi:hypothetical protein